VILSSRIVFVSLFLGLASGPQSIDVETDSAVKSVRMFLAGREVAALTQPPWHATIDLGRELDPRELETVGYDEKGNEVARATQILNLPRGYAEIEIALLSGPIGPIAAELRWEHIQFKPPKNAMMFFDGTRLKIDTNYHARFPNVDWSHPHLIAAEMKFGDGVVARREIVVGGAVADTAKSELTPILLTQTSAKPAASFTDCLLSGEQPVRTAAVEKPSAIVIFVRDPDASEAVHALDPTHAMRNTFHAQGSALRSIALDNGTSMRMLWSIPQKFVGPGHQRTALLFDSSWDVSASTFGLVWFVTREYAGLSYDEPRKFADAVAVAGLRAVSESRRRAVVLILSKHLDTSGNDPRAVRRYLAGVGVPLFVWSLTGPRPDLADSWGEVEDVSTIAGLRAASDRLRENLSAQRIAWVDVDPLTALRLHADPRCGMATVARLGM